VYKSIYYLTYLVNQAHITGSLKAHLYRVWHHMILQTVVCRNGTYLE